MSAVSGTTRGGVDFDDLASGKVGPYYAFRLTRTTETGIERDLVRAKYTLIKWVDDTIRDIEIQSDRRIAKFYIGKTYVRKVKKSKFDAMKPTTWRKGGISSRWHCHKLQSYGKSGMVVMTVVTKDDVPQQTIQALKHQEMYALALEQQLITHYAFIKGDDRLANTSIHPGMQQKDDNEAKAIGYPIYMAFALDDNDSDIDDNFDSGNEEQSSPSLDSSLATDQSRVSTEEQTNVTQPYQSEPVISSEGKNGILSRTGAALTSVIKDEESVHQTDHVLGNSNSRGYNVHFSEQPIIHHIDPAPLPSMDECNEEQSSPSLNSSLATDQSRVSTEEQTNVTQLDQARAGTSRDNPIVI